MNNHLGALSDEPKTHQSAQGASSVWASTKLQAHHRDRLAIVYVRQSTAQQVLENKESTARQYALVELAIELGWAPDRIEVIDEDQARSGSTAEGRHGFHRLLAEVGLDHVGIIFGIELCRLARSNKDWHQLIELCGIFRTVLADHDGLYDPTDFNDRLLLGLRGMMSEAELHILRGRMYEAVLNKARRGDLYHLPPIGYVKLPAGEFAIDPDEQVQGVVRLVFDEFDRRGTERGVLRYLFLQGIKMPIRPHAGPNRGNLEWRRPTRDAVNTILHHPLYAGIYRYGHRQVDPRRKDPERPGSGRVVVEPENYHALIPNRCPAYITMERYERNQKRILDNQCHAASKGAPRAGPSLLAGVAHCGRCGRRLMVHYSGKDGMLRYTCRYAKDTCDTAPCMSISGKVLDQLVAEKILSALEPAALELSLRATDDLQKEREQLDRNWKQRLERCRYEAERAERQYRVVEPENRLVVRELERRWEAALQELQQLEKEYARVRQAQPATLTVKERDLIRSLSKNLPLLWHAPTTTPEDRQRIVRLLLERVVVLIQGSSDRADVTMHWAGGFTSQHELTRPVLRYDQMVDYERLLSRIEELQSQGLSFAKIAEQLNQEGFRPAKRADKFHSDLVSRLARKLRGHQPGAKAHAHREFLKENEWLAIDFAAKLEMPKNTLFSWIRRGWVHVVRQLPGYRGRLICWADADELDRLGRLRQTKHGWWDPPLPAELTTPKVRATPAEQG
jgi:DNA invertase Pin-like site-specific DNA recombinase